MELDHKNPCKLCMKIFSCV